MKIPKLHPEDVLKASWKDGDNIMLLTRRGPKVVIYSWDGISRTYNLFFEFESIPVKKYKNGRKAY